MTSFDPQPWQPLPAPPLTDDLAKNTSLADATLWPTPGAGPEDVLVDSDGSAITGLDDGRIIRVSGDGTTQEIAHTKGRPLGIEWLGDGEMIVCSTDAGMQRVTMSGEVTPLASAFEGETFKFVNNTTVASDGTVYFSDTSTRWGIDTYINDLLEGRPTGRVFELKTDGALSVVAEGLQFANGVALDADETSLFVAETGRYRVYRHWLRGERAGETDLFLDNLAGFPDNLTFSDGILWVAMASPRQGIVDFMAPRNWMRSLSYRMPDGMKPKPVRHGMILGYDVDGLLVHNLQDTTGRVAITTSARVHNGRLYIGSLTEPHIAIHNLS
ncbi:MAG: SMP-30/gluconolactonase/LRE family protein [Actinomycetia bacterium]|nr:SMP-30/gluconolactonase/LRE family protein [Actinomycetes bacterium]